MKPGSIVPGAGDGFLFSIPRIVWTWCFSFVKAPGNMGKAAESQNLEGQKSKSSRFLGHVNKSAK